MSDPSTTPRDESRVAEIKAKIIEEGKKLSSAASVTAAFGNTFTGLVKQAIEAGATVDEIKAWGKEAGLVPQSVNLALRKAGIRQRAERSDKGKSKSGDPDPDPDADPAAAPTVPSVLINPPATLDAKVWADTLLGAMSGDVVAAGEFVEDMMEHLVAQPAKAA